MCSPLISIVVANYNYGRFLSETIESIIHQDGFDQCELIVVDGGSKDNSVDVIKKYSDKISWWCSEPDKGQSDAFNKGFAHAKGKLGCWVNADDLLLPGTVKAVLSEIEKNPHVEWISGGMVFFDSEERIMWMRRGLQPYKKLGKYMPGWVVGGPSSFFSIERLRSLSGFDVELHYTMDIDLWKKFFNAGMQLHHVAKYFWGFRVHEASKTSHSLMSAMNDKMRNETNVIMRRYVYDSHDMKIGALLLRLRGLLLGSYLKSALDTRRFRGSNVHLLGKCY